MDARPGAGNALLVALGDGLLAAGFLGQFQLLAELGQLLGGGDGGVGGGRLSVCGHWAHFPFPVSAWISLIAWLMCAPTLAMYGSSMAWMCSPPIGTTSRSDTNSPQPPSGLRVA